MPDSFRPAAPHGPLVEVRDNVFVVKGAMQVGPVRMMRNMTVVRRGTDLSIINSVRLSDDGEKELAKLGTVKNVVRPGYFHGIDDPYYQAKYEPRFFAGKRVVPVNVKNAEELVDGKREEFGDVFLFKSGTYDEACVLVDDLLVTCDSVQNYSAADAADFNVLGRVFARVFGLHGGVIVGTLWLKKMGGAQTLRADFQRLLQLPFKHFVAGHGAPVVDGSAHAMVQAAVERTIGT